MDTPPHNGRIFVASRNNLLVTGLTVLLCRADFDVAGFAEDTSQAIAEFDRTTAALCLLDMDLPGDLTLAVRQMSQTGWVVLLGSGNRPFDEPIHQSLRAGAVGYIAADIDSARLPHVLTAVMNGEVGIPRHMVAGLLAQLQNQPTRAVGVQSRRPVRFTTREWEVLASGRAVDRADRTPAGRLGRDRADACRGDVPPGPGGEPGSPAPPRLSLRPANSGRACSSS